MIKIKGVITSIVLVTVTVLGLMLGMLADTDGDGAPKAEERTALLSDSLSTVDIATGADTQYALIYSPSNQLNSTLATKLAALCGRTGALLRATPDSVDETEYEILIGETNRSESQAFLAEILAVGSPDEVLVWGYAYIDGKLLYCANGNNAFVYGQNDFLSLVAEDGTLRVASDLCVIRSKSVAEYEEELRLEAEADRARRLEELKAMNAAITDETMGVDEYKPMIGENGHYQDSPYALPWVYPAVGDHPRYIITESDLDEIAELLEDPEYESLAQEFRKLTEEDFNYGVFTGATYRYNPMILARIEARALAYLLTGDEVYAYEALIGIKNAMLTVLYTTALHPDTYHGPDHVMRVAAEVYDWCYDALSERDKWQLIAGVATIIGPQMESGMNYPPVGMNAVSGHGTGPQLLKSWMSAAMVFADEAPDWWTLVAGRYFEQYLPVALEIFKNGWISQGMGYGDSKLYNQLFATDVIYTATGENFFSEDADLALAFARAHFLPSYRYFMTGDGGRTQAEPGQEGAINLYFLYAALYNDPTVYALAKHLSNDHTVFVYDTIDTMSSVHQICYTSRVDRRTGDKFEDVAKIQYFDDPAGLMIARDAWGDENAVVVRMKIGDRTMGNHDIYDHGSFQIYYKGLLAAASGSYHQYNSPHHKYYTKSTVSRNGLLVFNPAFASDTPRYNDAGDVTNGESYYYSGSQEQRGEAGTLGNWMTETYTLADTTGAAIGYNPDGSSKYAYIAGDITPAYNAATVDYVGRRMLTVFTADASMPAIFFTYDQITSDSAAFTKTWLLHTVNEPEVNTENLTATVTHGEGKMYVQSVYGADEIVKIGGAGKAFWINGYYKADGTWVEGKNLTDSYHTSDYADVTWGRIELRAAGEITTDMLTVMGITDISSTATLTAEGFTNDTVYGAKVGDIMAVFVNTAERYFKEFTFTTEGEGLYNYYISGVEGGTWQVLVDGVSVAYALSDDSGAFLNFVAPAGEVTLRPGSDVIGENGGRIQYVTDGGILPADAPYVYKSDTPTPLPTELTRGFDTFVGWYTSPDFEEETRVTETPLDANGKLTFYARWFSTFLNEDYSSKNIHIGSTMLEDTNGVTYQGHQKVNVRYDTQVDENDVKYLQWVRGNNDPLICQKSLTKNFSKVGSEEKTVSFTFRISRDGEATPMASALHLLAKVNVNGENLSSSTRTPVFAISSKGNVTLGNTAISIGTLEAGEITEVRIAVDFKNGEMRAYDSEYNVMATAAFKAPAATLAANTEEFMKCLTEYLWYWYAGADAYTDAALRIYGIRVQEGDEFKDKAVIQTEGIKYNMNGTPIPKDAPRDFNADGTQTLLPATVDRTGYIFAGWYTTPTFDEGTETVAAPADSEGLYEVWARWFKILVDENYEKNSVGVKESSTSVIGGISYNAGHGGEPKPGSTFYTEKDDASGNTYLKASVMDKNTMMTVNSDEYNLTHFTETAISFQLDLAKFKDLPLSSYSMRLTTSALSYGSRVIISMDGATGKIKLDGSGVAFAQITEEVTTVRLTVDFAAETLTAYAEDGLILDTVPLGSVPTAKEGYDQPATWLEWQKVAKSSVFYGYQSKPSGVSETLSYLYYDNIRVVEGRVWGTGYRPAPDPDVIEYKTLGGTLPEDAPLKYDPENETPLPTEVTRNGYVFAGWYTSEDYLAETKVTSVPAGGTEAFAVYAKWFRVAVDESYEKNTVGVKESSMATVGGITYNAGHSAELKPGSTFYTEKDDASGNTYLKVSVMDKNAVMTVNSDSYNLTHFAETAISFELDLAKFADLPLSSWSMRLSSTSTNFGAKSLVSMDGKTGKIKLDGSGVAFAQITEEVTTVRLTVDFAAETLTAYGEEGEILDTVPLGAVPTAKEGYTQATTWKEWQSLAVSNLFYGYHSRPSGVEAGTVTYLYLDNLRVVDGRLFGDGTLPEPDPDDIVYETLGGTLPEDAPEKYGAVSDTPLPTDVTREGYVFGGWYTDEDHAADSKVTVAPAGGTEPFRVYAKWLTVLVDENYEKNTVAVKESSTSIVDGISYNAGHGGELKPGSTFYTEKDDASGNTYLKASVMDNNALITISSDTSNYSTLKETAVSFRLDVGKIKDAPLSSYEIRVSSTGGYYGNYSLILVEGNTGDIKFVKSSNVIANIADDSVAELRLTVDFEAATATAYDASGEVVDSISLGDPPTAKEGYTQAATWAEWQRLAKNYLFYSYQSRPSSVAVGTQSYIYLDNLQIIDGRAFGG